MLQDRTTVIGATQIVVGLSAITRIQAGYFQAGWAIKILSGGGTLEICKPPIALSGTSATGWNTGYFLGASEVFAIDGPATFYLAATGATMTAALAIANTAGATIGA